ncbi:MAG: tetratricopeptide repeat protein, partial [bacterium]
MYFKKGTILTGIKTFLLFLILMLIVNPATASSLLSRGRTLRIEPVDLLEPEQWRFGLDVRHESRRIAAEIDGEDLKYNNTRLRPFSLQTGLLNNLELGVIADYSLNSASNPHGYPDANSLEGITLQSRVKWHRYFGTSMRVKFSPDNEIQPYGSDRVGLQLNFPIQFPLADGMFHGEFGYTFQGGGFYDGSGNKVTNWDDYINVGLGYQWSDGRFMTYSVELVGHAAPLESVSAGGGTDSSDTDSSDTGSDGIAVDSNHHLELLLGATVHLSPHSRIIPSVGMGLLEGSPDLSVGVRYELDFGRAPRVTSEEPRVPERYSRRRPVGGPEEEFDEIFRQKEEGKKQETASERVSDLKEQARRAYRAGEYSEAIDNFRKILLIDPDDALVHANLGSLYYRQR